MKVNSDTGTVNILNSISSQNMQSKMISYNISRYCKPFEIVHLKEGDCTSFCELYNTLIQGCGLPLMELVHLERPFSFVMSKKCQVVNIEPGESVNFARHTILAFKNEDGSDGYFDPVIGKHVNPAYYGKSIDNYIIA